MKIAISRNLGGTEVSFYSYDELKDSDLIDLYQRYISKESEDVFISVNGMIEAYKLQWNKIIFVRKDSMKYRYSFNELLVGKRGISDCFEFE